MRNDVHAMWTRVQRAGRIRIEEVATGRLWSKRIRKENGRGCKNSIWSKSWLYTWRIGLTLKCIMPCTSCNQIYISKTYYFHTTYSFSWDPRQLNSECALSGHTALQPPSTYGATKAKGCFARSSLQHVKFVHLCQWHCQANKGHSARWLLVFALA